MVLDFDGDGSQRFPKGLWWFRNVRWGIFKCWSGYACHNCPEWVRIWDGIIGFSGLESSDGVINGAV